MYSVKYKGVVDKMSAMPLLICSIELLKNIHTTYYGILRRILIGGVEMHYIYHGIIIIDL